MKEGEGCAPPSVNCFKSWLLALLNKTPVAVCSFTPSLEAAKLGEEKHLLILADEKEWHRGLVRRAACECNSAPTALVRQEEIL